MGAWSWKECKEIPQSPVMLDQLLYHHWSSLQRFCGFVSHLGRRSLNLYRNNQHVPSQSSSATKVKCFEAPRSKGCCCWAWCRRLVCWCLATGSRVLASTFTGGCSTQLRSNQPPATTAPPLYVCTHCILFPPPSVRLCIRSGPGKQKFSNDHPFILPFDNTWLNFPFSEKK